MESDLVTFERYQNMPPATSRYHSLVTVFGLTYAEYSEGNHCYRFFLYTPHVRRKETAYRGQDFFIYNYPPYSQESGSGGYRGDLPHR